MCRGAEVGRLAREGMWSSSKMLFVSDVQSFCRASVWLLRYEEALHHGLLPIRTATSVDKLWVVVRTLYYKPLKVSIMVLTQLARIPSTALKNFQQG